jgi:hypothetical protein
VRAEWAVTLGWALLNGVLLTLQFLFPTRFESRVTTGGVVGALALLAAVLFLLRRRGEPVERRVPDTSWATVFCAIGATTAIIGFAFGPWLYIPGLGVLAVGLLGLGREWLAERRPV